MKPRKTTYFLHRWLGLIVGVQLLLWSSGGFMFSILDIEDVRGTTDNASDPFVQLDADATVPSATLLDLASTHAIGGVLLHDRGVGPFWEVRDTKGELIARLDPTTGEPTDLLTPEEAEQLARRDFEPTAAGATVTLIEADPPIEYRSGPLPAYAVHLEHAREPHIYIDARTGRVTARRNGEWRLFDFFWMLHTMDYFGRDDFNTAWLSGFSLLAMLTSATGLSLWAWRASSRLKKRRSTPPSAS